MVNLNFTLPDELHDNVEKIVAKKGYPNKAQFLRFAVADYIKKAKNSTYRDQKFLYLEARLVKLIERKLVGKKLPSLEEQLAKI